jgi:hypothetical protein
MLRRVREVCRRAATGLPSRLSLRAAPVHHIDLCTGAEHHVITDVAAIMPSMIV